VLTVIGQYAILQAVAMAGKIHIKSRPYCSSTVMTSCYL